MQSPDHCLLWGKHQGLDRPYPLLAHMIDTSAAADVFLNSVFGLERLDSMAHGFNMAGQDVASLIRWMAGAHDVGKASMGFQSQVPSAFEDFASKCGLLEKPTERVYHQQFSELFVRERFGDSPGAEFAGAVVRGHHGQFGSFPTWPEDLLETDAAGQNKQFISARCALFDALRSAFDDEPRFDEIEPKKWFATFSTGVVSICDWIVSDTAFLSSRLDPDLVEPAEYFRRSRDELTDRFVDLGLVKGGLDGRSFSELFPGFTPRGAQSAVDSDLASYVDRGDGAGGLCIIMAPTGEGKTEAGLAAASLLSKPSSSPGLFFGLPTMATSDAMYERVSDFLGDKETNGLVTLNHSLAGMNVSYTSGDLSSTDSETAQVAIRWLRGRHRGLLGPNAVGTVDQLLAMALSTKYGFIRHVGLAGKTVIIDEAHDYDAFMRALLARALEWLGASRVPVVLMSATLPERYVSTYLTAYQRGVGFTETTCAPTYPGVMAWVPGLDPVTISTEAPQRLLNLTTCEYGQSEGAREAAVEAALNDFSEGCVAVICNTVRSAQETFLQLKEFFGEGSVPIELLHSRLPMGQRKERTQRTLNLYGKDSIRPKFGIVVATQVIEQSLDLDFDLLVTDLAPIAQLLQRAGRCHRHAGRSRPAELKDPQIKVLTPTRDGDFFPPMAWCFVYSKAEIKKTASLLRTKTAVRVPDDVQEMVNFVDEFDLADGVDEGLRKAEMDRFAGESSDAHTAELFSIPSPHFVSTFDELTSAETDERLSTRLGSGSKLALFVIYENGSLSFSDGSSVPQTELTTSSIRRILSFCCPVPDRPGSWVNSTEDKSLHRIPGWADVAWLKDVVVVVSERSEDGALTAQVDNKPISLDPLLGLVEEKRNA